MCICHTANLLCFNSRTLGRVRQIYLPTLDEERGVSIHAPWEGCDRYTTIFIVARIMFQFTHPGKGATNRTLPKEEVLRVSIHAPWEGCDGLGGDSVEASLLFQFTHPGKGATYLVRYLTTFPWFQFTHPGKGATSPRSPRSPWTPCFNSRTLGRVRPKRARHRGQAACFNSRTLGRVRRERLRYKHLPHRQFQFTHPGKGATWTLF